MELTPLDVREPHEDLVFAARRVRARCVRMAGEGGAFLGAALSAADLLTYLYGVFLSVRPENAARLDRDYFLLSKGHAVPALYGALAEYGFLSETRLAHHLDVEDSIYWHPNRDVPGVDFHTGSLGHALAVGVGIAMDIRLLGRSDRVVVMLGDGELDEGSVWEAMLVAAAHRLDNLLVVIDRNGLQANEATEALVPLEPLADKLLAFGFRALEADGHSFSDLARAFAIADQRTGAPTAIIARTVRGKGLPSLEGRPDAWFVNLDAAGVARHLEELSAHGALASMPVGSRRLP